MQNLARKVEIDFTDEAITGSAGSIFLSRMAEQLELGGKLAQALELKQRRRGASDVDTIQSLIFSLAQGDGKLVDVDRLRADEARTFLLGLEEVPGSRRASDYLKRFSAPEVERLREVALALAIEVGRAVVAHDQQRLGYVPVFVDGTSIEVSGQHFEKAKVGYTGQLQYWQHSVYVGRLWASQQLFPGDVAVTHGWREQLDELAPLLRDAQGVWLRVDNAYYDRAVTEYCRAKGWDYSISVTNGTFKKPLIKQLDELEDDDWQPLEDSQEEAAWLAHRPAGWPAKEVYVVVRTWWDGEQKLLTPRHTFILTNRTDLPLAEVIKRHRGKQGQENAQKGPLIDLDLHHPPCRRYQANRAFYTAGQIAQILLCAVQYHLLPVSARKHGIRTIIRDMIRTAGKLVRHSRRWVIRFSKAALRLDWIAHAADQLEALPP